MKKIYDVACKAMQAMMNLQMFADTQTTLLALEGNDLSPEMKVFYSDTLIDHAEPALVYDQFGDKYPIPKGSGKTIEFRKFSPLPKAIAPLTEGVTPKGNKLNVTTITAEVKQYGDFIEMSDVLELTAIDNVLVQATKLLGGQSGRTLDTIVRDIVTAGNNVMYAPKENGDEVTSRTGIDKTCLLTPDQVFVAVANLKAMNANPINGDFIAVVHPYITADIMRSEEWQNFHRYTDAEKIYEGDIGKIGNVRFVESSEAKIFEDKGSDGSAIYGTMVFGANAYGTTEITGGGLEFIVKQKGSAGTADPLNQRSTTGWKAIKTAERLVEEYMIRIEHGSKTGATAATN